MSTPEKTPVEKMQHVAFQLSVMAAGAPPQGSLARMLKEMANDLNSALAALGHKTAESVQDGMTRALAQHGIYGVNPLFLGVTYEGRPAINYKVQDLGLDWADDEVSALIVRYCIVDMLGIQDREFYLQWRANRAGLISRFLDAAEVWT